MTGHTYTITPHLTLFHADCREALRALPDNCIDAVPTDPPYALVSIVKRFGGPNAAPAKGNDAYMRASAGFMGKQWDTGECAMDPTFWAEVFRVLKPGGHVAAFGASRGYHRMACAIEDAGFEIRDSLMWLYGTGFPKSHDVSKGIDRIMGAERTDRRNDRTVYAIGHSGNLTSNVPATDAAREWEGFGTALKPAFEPIVLARKPLSEPTVAANVLKWRTGALNIDGCRVPGEGGTPRQGEASQDRRYTEKGSTNFAALPGPRGGSPEGRWPANVVTDGSDEVVGMFPTSSTTGKRTARSKAAEVAGTNWLMTNHESTEYTDSGSAARFFYSAKASRQDRNGSKHPTVKPISLMQWLARLITPPGGTVLDPFAGSGTTGAAAMAEGFNAILCERELEYVQDILRRFGQVQDSPPLAPI